MRMPEKNFSSFFAEFQASYDDLKRDAIWEDQSAQFRDFWNGRIMAADSDFISEEDCDRIIKILDSNGKGNNRQSEAVARAMVSQGAWRRLFNELHKNKKLGSAVNKILIERSPNQKAQFIDELYRMEEAQRIYLTGKSGNTISAFIAAYDPFSSLSIISLKDRQLLLEYLESPYAEEMEKESIGKKIINSGVILSKAINESGVIGNARKISQYCYFSPVRELWRGEFTAPVDGTQANSTKDITVTVSKDEDDSNGTIVDGEIRESIRVQGLLAKIGEAMGFDIWLPNPDRARVAKVWQPQDPANLLKELPLAYDSSTLSTIKLIDVIWLRNGRYIARAFEVEDTTSIYSGILRMADLVALQPNISIKMHIVAPIERLEKFLTEIRRPVFSYMTHARLSDMCTFISYDDVRLISELRHLNAMRDEVLSDYEVDPNQAEG